MGCSFCVQEVFVAPKGTGDQGRLTLRPTQKSLEVLEWHNMDNKLSKGAHYPYFVLPNTCSNPPRRGLASVGVGVLGAPDPAPEAVTNYYVTRPPPPGRQPFSKPRNAAP